MGTVLHHGRTKKGLDLSTHGIRQVGFWTVAIGATNHDLYYLLEWESLAEREKKWTTFMGDPEWILGGANAIVVSGTGAAPATEVTDVELRYDYQNDLEKLWEREPARLNGNPALGK